jgi:hypothetical protein
MSLSLARAKPNAATISWPTRGRFWLVIAEVLLGIEWPIYQCGSFSRKQISQAGELFLTAGRRSHRKRNRQRLASPRKTVEDSEMKEAASTGGLTFVFPQHLTGRIMNEVGLGAGQTHYWRVTVFLILRHVR